MATLTKKDLLEAIEDMPENMPIMIYHGAYYVPIEFIEVRKLWDCGKQVETICIEPKRLKVKSC